MLDIKLCLSGDFDGDLYITDDGDIQLTDNLLQDIRIAIRWILGEWRLGPDIGLPWYEEIFVKNPDTDLICQEITTAILDIERITDAEVEILEFDKAARRIRLQFSATTDDETYSGEVTVGG